jgi:hypothetical protein
VVDAFLCESDTCNQIAQTFRDWSLYEKKTDPEGQFFSTQIKLNWLYLISTAGDRGIEPGTFVRVNICDSIANTCLV